MGKALSKSVARRVVGDGWADFDLNEFSSLEHGATLILVNVDYSVGH